MNKDSWIELVRKKLQYSLSLFQLQCNLRVTCMHVWLREKKRKKSHQISRNFCLTNVLFLNFRYTREHSLLDTQMYGWNKLYISNIALG